MKKFKPAELDVGLLKELSKARTAEQRRTINALMQRRTINALMQRYGVHHANQLLPEQVDPFCGELRAALTGKLKPEASTLDPSIVEVRKS